MGEEAALAHLQLRREAADRQALEPVGRGEVDGPLEDRGAGLRALAGFRRAAVGSSRSIGSGYKKARTFVQSYRMPPETDRPRGGGAMSELRGEEDRRDGGGLPRRLQARPGRARRRVVRHADHRPAPQLRELPRARPLRATARRRSSWRCAAAARSRSRASASRSTPITSSGSAAGTKRKVWPGDDGIRLLVIGGVPGGAYEAAGRTRSSASPTRWPR